MFRTMIAAALVGAVAQSAPAADNVSAKAQAALALGRVAQKAQLTLQPRKAPPGPPCDCTSNCACAKDACDCHEVGHTRCSTKCTCDLKDGETCPAEDGGPAWTWDATRKGWYRVVEYKVPAPAPAPMFQVFPMQPRFFAPPMGFGGGMRMGGSRCGGGG